MYAFGHVPASNIFAIMCMEHVRFSRDTLLVFWPPQCIFSNHVERKRSGMSQVSVALPNGVANGEVLLLVIMPPHSRPCIHLICL